MTEPVDVVGALAEDLLVGVAAAIVSSGLGAPRWQYVSAGPPAFMDGAQSYCCAGLLTVWPTRIYVSNRFPEDDPAPQNARCPTGSLVADLSVQYARCQPTVTNAGTIPDTVLDGGAGLDFAVAMLAVSRGMACVVTGWNSPNDPGVLERDAVYRSVDLDGEPSGGCVSMTGTVTVSLDDCLCPELPWIAP